MQKENINLHTAAIVKVLRVINVVTLFGGGRVSHMSSHGFWNACSEARLPTNGQPPPPLNNVQLPPREETPRLEKVNYLFDIYYWPYVTTFDIDYNHNIHIP